MSRIVSLLVAMVVIAPVLAGCENFDPDSLDPFGLNQKKPLPGKRELLFPEGVPGVTQGIPPEYTAGHQSPGNQDLTFDGTADQQAAGTTGVPAATTARRAPTTPVRQTRLGEPLQVHKPVAKSRPKARPRPKRRVVKPRAKPKPKPTETASKPQATESPWPSATEQKTTQKGTSAPWPSTTSSQQRNKETQAGWPGGQQQEQKLAPWPSAPPSGTFSKQ
jgi:hypothetical protein